MRETQCDDPVVTFSVLGFDEATAALGVAVAGHLDHRVGQAALQRLNRE